jgi:DNA repair protein RecO (recombination protein O)
MEWVAPALVCALSPHGEHGVLARVLTHEHGLVQAFVPGGRSSKMRATLIPGNSVVARWRARTLSQLGSLQLELLRARSSMLFGAPAALLLLNWVMVLTTHALPPGTPYPRIYQACEALLDLLELSKQPRQWAAALVRYELTLLAELGFGLELGRCAATGGCEDLCYVSPRSAQAVSRAAGQPFHHRLLPLPAFLLGVSEHVPSGSEIADGLRLSGHFLTQHIIPNKYVSVHQMRDFLLDSLLSAS